MDANIYIDALVRWFNYGLTINDDYSPELEELNSEMCQRFREKMESEITVKMVNGLHTALKEDMPNLNEYILGNDVEDAAWERISSAYHAVLPFGKNEEFDNFVLDLHKEYSDRVSEMAEDVPKFEDMSFEAISNLPLFLLANSNSGEYWERLLEGDFRNSKFVLEKDVRKLCIRSIEASYEDVLSILAENNFEESLRKITDLKNAVSDMSYE